MAIKQKPFQGISNIIRFNRHFYVVAGLSLAALLWFRPLFPQSMQVWLLVGTAIALFSVLTSLVVSWYVYDLSDLYQINWLTNADNLKILNIHAGFDETSEVIKNKYKNTDLTVCDFFDPAKHTEVSIQRARKAFPPHAGTIPVRTSALPFADHTFDKILAVLSAHEIRDEAERILFFKELRRITKESGQILVTEHLRDMNNFLAYTVGVFHFHSKKTWVRTFHQAGLTVKQEIKTTPFVTTFIVTV